MLGVIFPQERTASNPIFIYLLGTAMGTTGPPYWMENEPHGYNSEEEKFEDCLAMIYRTGQTSEGKFVHLFILF